MATDILKLKYDDPKLGQRVKQFATNHKSAEWKHFARFNLSDVVIAATKK